MLTNYWVPVPLLLKSDCYSGKVWNHVTVYQKPLLGTCCAFSLHFSHHCSFPGSFCIGRSPLLFHHSFSSITASLSTTMEPFLCYQSLIFQYPRMGQIVFSSITMYAFPSLMEGINNLRTTFPIPTDWRQNEWHQEEYNFWCTDSSKLAWLEGIWILLFKMYPRQMQCSVTLWTPLMVCIEIHELSSACKPTQAVEGSGLKFMSLMFIPLRWSNQELSYQNKISIVFPLCPCNELPGSKYFRGGMFLLKFLLRVFQCWQVHGIIE